MKEPMKTPVKGTCIRTGRAYLFSSMAETAAEGFHPGCVRNCIRGRAKTHAGFKWEAVGPLRTADTKGGPRVNQAAALYRSGLNYEEVADQMGLTKATARLYVNQARSLGLMKEVQDVQ